VLLEWRRRRGAGEFSGPFGVKPGIEIATGSVAGVATALVGMAGPPVLIYLPLAGAPPRTVRATLLSFFAFAYAASLASHAVTVGIPTGTWLSAGILIPFALLGALAGRPLSDRVGADAFTILAILLLAAAGLYNLTAAAAMAVR
jgi:uncharacterized membrane protein YfcA